MASVNPVDIKRRMSSTSLINQGRSSDRASRRAAPATGSSKKQSWVVLAKEQGYTAPGYINDTENLELAAERLRVTSDDEHVREAKDNFNFKGKLCEQIAVTEGELKSSEHSTSRLRNKITWKIKKRPILFASSVLLTSFSFMFADPLSQASESRRREFETSYDYLKAYLAKNSPSLRNKETPSFKCLLTSSR